MCLPACRPLYVMHHPTALQNWCFTLAASMLSLLWCIILGCIRCAECAFQPATLCMWCITLMLFLPASIYIWCIILSLPVTHTSRLWCISLANSPERTSLPATISIWCTMWLPCKTDASDLWWAWMYIPAHRLSHVMHHPSAPSYPPPFTSACALPITCNVPSCVLLFVCDMPCDCLPKLMHCPSLLLRPPTSTFDTAYLTLSMPSRILTTSIYISDAYSQEPEWCIRSASTLDCLFSCLFVMHRATTTSQNWCIDLQTWPTFPDPPSHVCFPMCAFLSVYALYRWPVQTNVLGELPLTACFPTHSRCTRLVGLVHCTLHLWHVW